MTALAELVALTPAEHELTRSTGWKGLGQLIAHYRGAAKLSITAVSEATGIEWPRLRRIERGGPHGMDRPNARLSDAAFWSPPTTLELESIARVLGVPAQPLVERAARVRRGEA